MFSSIGNREVDQVSRSHAKSNQIHQDNWQKAELKYQGQGGRDGA